MFGHGALSQNVSRFLIFSALSLLAIAVFHGTRGTLVRMVWARIFSPPDAQLAATYKANATTRNGSNTPSAKRKKARAMRARRPMRLCRISNRVAHKQV